MPHPCLLQHVWIKLEQYHIASFEDKPSPSKQYKNDAMYMETTIDDKSICILEELFFML